MKKNATTALILTTSMMLALMGCGAASTDTDSSSDTASVAEDIKDKDNSDTESKASVDPATIAESSLEYKGEKFSPLEDLQSTLDKAGSVAELASGCPKEVGIDSGNFEYMYDVVNEEKDEAGLFIETRQENDDQGIWQISSSNPDVKTSTGIHPGSTEAEVTDAYGKPDRKDDEYNFSVYDFGNYCLTFSIENGKVTRITSENAMPITEDTLDNSNNEPKAPVDPATITESSIEYKGETFSPFEDLQASLDKADSVGKRSSDSPVQLAEGNPNYTYYYDVIDAQNSESGLSFSTTDDDNGKQIIMQVTSFDPSAKTTKGIHPGSTKDELFAAYGEKKPDELGFCSYDFETYGLLFKVSNDKVIMIASETMNYLD